MLLCLRAGAPNVTVGVVGAAAAAARFPDLPAALTGLPTVKTLLEVLKVRGQELGAAAARPAAAGPGPWPGWNFSSTRLSYQPPPPSSEHLRWHSPGPVQAARLLSALGGEGLRATLFAPTGEPRRGVPAGLPPPWNLAAWALARGPVGPGLQQPGR